LVETRFSTLEALNAFSNLISLKYGNSQAPGAKFSRRLPQA
jgi:hypothetical protein